MNTTLRESLVKVAFPLPKGHKLAVETMWAKPIDLLAYEIASVPFFTYDISFGDVVNVKVDPSGTLAFTGVSRRSGHSTFRVIPAITAAFELAWTRLDALGCTYERATAKLIAVDVPASVDATRVERILDEEERNGSWQYEVGHRYSIESSTPPT